ncbi:MAG TPA: protein-disulfide reductase DsbD domain-containing protein [Pyrinomonadaceae bacterium]|jgi:hypothetical protein
MTRPRKLLLFSSAALLVLACAACGGQPSATGGNTDADSKAASATTAVKPETTATTATSAPGAPSANIVRASAEALEIRAGGAAEASVRLEIDEGYHVNANPPTHSYLIPTELSVAAEEGISPGKPVYPPALSKKFAFDPQMLAVYEGAVFIKLPLRAEAVARKGSRTLSAKVRVQPCDDSACYPPRTIETSIPVNVK